MAFIYSLRIWMSAIIIGGVFVTLQTFLWNGNSMLGIQTLPLFWLLGGIYTFPAFLVLFICLLVLPTRENNIFAQKLIYSILIILLVLVTGRFTILATSIELFEVLILFFYSLAAISAMLYFYPKGINKNSTQKEKIKVLDDDL